MFIDFSFSFFRVHTVPTGMEKRVSLLDVQRHGKKEDAWIIIDGKVIMSFSVGVGGLWRISVSVKLCPEAVCYFGSHCQIYNCVIILTLFILMMQLLPWLFLGYSSATPPLFLGHFSATRLFLGHFLATTRLFLGHFLATPRLFPGHFSCCILFSVYAFVTAGGPC